LASATLDTSCDVDREAPVQKSMADVSLRSLLILPTVFIPIANYGILAVLDTSLRALLPLFFSTPIYLGGLGFTPSSIGLWLALFGIAGGGFQAMFFARIVDWIGPKRLFCVSVSCFAPAMIMFPIMSWLVQARGMVDHAVTLVLISQLVLFVISDMAFGAVYGNNTGSVITTNALNYRDHFYVYHSFRSFK